MDHDATECTVFTYHTNVAFLRILCSRSFLHCTNKDTWALKPSLGSRGIRRMVRHCAATNHNILCDSDI
jgi:hypothetical protein